MNIYVGNLSFSITEKALKNLFVDYGEVASAKLIKDKFSRNSKRYGFIEMPSNSDADRAIKALNGNRIDGSSIKVKPADDGGKKRNKNKKYRRRREY